MNLFQVTKPFAELFLWARSLYPWRGVRFICYHGITDGRNSDDLYSITGEEFRLHLNYFSSINSKVISFDKAVNLLSNEINKEQYISITFDDGRMDNYEIAWPILREYDLTAHFFIVSDWINKRINGVDYMTIQQIQEILKGGGTFGSHGKSHKSLVGIENSLLDAEVLNARDSLGGIIGSKPISFAYPYSAFNNLVINAVRKAGYGYGFKLDYSSTSKITDSNRMTIPRTLISGSHMTWLNYYAVSGAYDWQSIYSKIKRNIRPSVMNWKT